VSDRPEVHRAVPAPRPVLRSASRSIASVVLPREDLHQGITSASENKRVMSNAIPTIPGPRGHFLLGSLPAIRRDRVQFLVDLRRDYGDVVRIRVGPVEALAIFHPDAIQRVMQDNQANYSKDTIAFNSMRLIFGNGLITSNGDFWLRQRRLMQPSFHKERINRLCDMIVQQTRMALDALESAATTNQAINMTHEMMNLTMGVATQALFGTRVQDVDGNLSEMIYHLASDTTFRFEHPFYPPLWFPASRNRRLNKALKRLDDVISGIIDERRAHPGERDDVLQMMIDAQVEERDVTGDEPRRMTDKQLRDEVVTLLLAGHESTSVSLCWTLYLLSQHPDVESRLRREVDDVLGSRPPRLEDLPRLEYGRMVRDESMRLYPPVWLTERKSIDEDVLCGYRIPAGITMAITQYVTHRHPEFWDDPDAFRPERFSPECSRGRHEYAFFPFSGGGRQCLGKSLALLEIQIILAMLLQRYRYDLKPGSPVVKEPELSLRQKGGLWMHLKPM
jgi:cytochrome P450